MRWYAQELGYGEDADFWAAVGLLHDVDFEKWPEAHCKKAPELLAEIGCSDEFIHAVCSHGYGLCSDVEPTEEMEKVLFVGRADGPHRRGGADAPQQELPGHGGQLPEEEVQGQEVRRPAAPGTSSRPGLSGWGGRWKS